MYNTGKNPAQYHQIIRKSGNTAATIFKGRYFGDREMQYDEK